MISRNNHYVPRWYQEGFFEPGKSTYSYLDMSPQQHTLPDGRIVPGKQKFSSPTSRAFCQSDLYSTFFATTVNDEIERKLFGSIDARGAHAVRAFSRDDIKEWHENFQVFFEYIDIQKIRTPKGLDWLKAQYPRLTQNELMQEMQGIRRFHCTIWTEGVREIVSAQDSNVKFLVSDHPVTVYNHALSPDSAKMAYPNDPSIALKGSQTIFPLNRDYCLILTNLEYAKDWSVSPIENRTFARNFRNTMVRTDAFIRTRKLDSHEVIRINRIMKSRAKRYIAAGKEEWLYPENVSQESWHDLRETLLPPRDQMLLTGGELYVSFDDGRVYFQDAFGRTEQERDFLNKPQRSGKLKARDFCGCGSGRAYKICCEAKPVALRPTWEVISIRERNMILFNGIRKILDISESRDWASVRRDITDEKISEVYSLYDALWPLETDLLSMLPKPDGQARGIYTGLLHPRTIANCALGSTLYFDELLVEHPFVHPRTVKDEFSPVKNPQIYRQEFLKSLVLFLHIVPFIENGLINLFPDPCNFDFHLRDQMYNMATMRSRFLHSRANKEPELVKVFQDDYRRSLMLLPRDTLKDYILRSSPHLDSATFQFYFR